MFSTAVCVVECFSLVLSSCTNSHRGIENTNHQIETVIKEKRTASLTEEKPNHSGVVTMTDGPKDKDGKVGEGPDDTTSSASGLVGSGITAVVGGVAIALM